MKKILFFAILIIAHASVMQAQSRKVQTTTNHVDHLNNDCKETFSYYYDENDNKILHGKYSFICNTNKQGYVFKKTETVSFVDGVLNGPYTYSYTLNNRQKTSMATRSYGRYRDFLSVSTADDKVTGAFNMGKATGVWKLSYKRKSTLDKEVLEDKAGSITVTMDNGRAVGVQFPNGHKYTIAYKQDTTKDTLLCFVSGSDGTYTVKNNIIVSHFVRLNDDITPIDDDELRSIIGSIKENNDSVFLLLLDKGYRITGVNSSLLYYKTSNSLKDRFLQGGYLHDFYNHIEDNGKPMLRQADDKKYYYYIVCRVKLVDYEVGKNIIDNILQNGGYSQGLDYIFRWHLNPGDGDRKEYFSSTTVEQLREYYEQRSEELRRQEEARQAELRRQEEERRRQEEERRRQEEERQAEIRRKEEALKKAQERYNEFGKDVVYIKKCHGHYMNKLNLTKYLDREYILNADKDRLKGAARTYQAIAVSQLNIENKILERRESGFSIQDEENGNYAKLYVLADSLKSFYNMFYHYVVEADLIDTMNIRAKTIKEECGRDAKDVYAAYKQVYSTMESRQLFMSFDELRIYADAINAHLQLQQQCRAFIKMRHEMDTLNETINDSKAKYIRKLYNAYYEAANKNWTPQSTLKQLEPIMAMQKRIAEIVSREDIKDFDKQLKKDNVSSLEEVLTKAKQQ